MDASAALTALKSGDVLAFVTAVEWDESEWIEMPADLRNGDGLPFMGRLGAVTVGIVDTGRGKYDFHLHNHLNGEDEAKACYTSNAADIHALIEQAAAMSNGPAVPAVGLVAMSEIPYSGGMYI